MLRVRLVLPIAFLALATLAPSATSAQSPPPIVIHEGGDPTTWGYTPASTTVPVGTTVTWTNSGAFPHDAASTDGSWKTPLLDPGASGTVTFSTPGTFTYICTPHPWMQATIVVSAASPPPTPTAATNNSAVAPPPAAPSDNSSSQATQPSNTPADNNSDDSSN
jgi:plastocyanin